MSTAATLNPPETETPAAAIEPEQGVCAVLYLPKVKQRGKTMVRGRNGKYQFSWSERHGKSVRVYRSIAQFQKEEFDLRDVSQPTPICVLLGEIDPAANAIESVKALIASNRTLSILVREQYLEEIGDLAFSEVKRIRDSRITPPEAPAPNATPEQPLNPAPVKTVAVWKEEKTSAELDLAPNALAPNVAPPAAQDALAPNAAPGKHAHADLMEMPIADLRARAKVLAEAKGQPPLPGNVSRTMAANFIIANQ